MGIRVPLALGIALALGACSEVASPYIDSTSRLGNTPDTVGPYVVQSVVIGVVGSDRVELNYTVDDENRYVPLLMAEANDGERFSAGIPGQPTGTEILYYVAVVRDGERWTADPDGAGAVPYRFTIE